ncbi:PIN domain-containing protein [Saccharolobus islandicus]|uniref:PilT protein domain protein n=2 Tax=Saccharolobus islandicus TaxID=43080 RepID=C4KKM6_SACI6|nr:PIN domain-containing protein [Sulfolobus islandicus]ACP56224.1 PilT protein domain protein [Sulfolobus islandicus M.16.27]ACR42888.1 PilT protein domain protein [Sulfolobus islandicus M.16.4]
MEKAIVDTSVIIYDYVEDSEYHKRAEELLDSLDRWVIPVIVVHEIMSFLKGMKLEDKVDDVLAYSRSEKAEVVCDCTDNVIDAIGVLKKEKLPLISYKNMVILSHAIREKLPLATFDRELSKIAKKYSVSLLQS